MSNSKAIKSRIKSVKSTKKITKAMELVAASKMKRAVSSTFASRLYAQYSWEILESIAKNVEEITHPFFNQREEKEKSGKVLLMLITSNRGLCGAYNAQVIKTALNLIKNETRVVEIINIGKRGDTAMRRLGKNIIASFNELPTNISLYDILPISKLIIDEYNIGNYEEVFIVYTDFISALNQKPNIKNLLPISKSILRELIDIKKDDTIIAEQKVDYIFEGDQDKLIVSIAEKILRMQIYQTLLESNASEQSSRMVAMKNASEASGEMIDDLTLIFNKARQSNITREISEISAGMASVS